MLVALLGDDRIEAARGLRRQSEFRCPGCGNPVVMHARIGGWVIPHFKHKADSTCRYGKGETPEHRAVKALLRDYYRSKGFDVQVEYDLPPRRADVFIPKFCAAFEVEFSPKESREFIAKCKDYQRGKIKSVWILRQKRVEVASVQVGKTILISVSPVLEVMCSKHRPLGAKAAFFAYNDKEAVVFRGDASSHMLYKKYGDYSGAGGHEYPSRSKMWLTIKEVIRLDQPPRFPADQGKHHRLSSRHIEPSKDACFQSRAGLRPAA